MRPPTRLERKKIVGEYVRRRLLRECEGQWGKAFAISREIGFSAAHMSNIRDGHRNVGDSLALAIARYWGMGYAQLERAALDEVGAARRRKGPPPVASLASAPDAPAVDDALPSLTATLAYCRGGLYARSFLDEYEREARRLPYDRPRSVWLADIEVKHWEWRHRHRLAKTEGSSARRHAAELDAKRTKTG